MKSYFDDTRILIRWAFHLYQGDSREFTALITGSGTPSRFSPINAVVKPTSEEMVLTIEPVPHDGRESFVSMNRGWGLICECPRENSESFV